MRQIEREEEDIERRYAEGLLTAKEYQEKMRDLYRDYRAQAEEAAEQAYRDELERW